MKETLLHLMEELGELTWCVLRMEPTNIEKVEDEIADVLSLVLHSANALKVGAEKAWTKKLEKDEKRFPRVA